MSSSQLPKISKSSSIFQSIYSKFHSYSLSFPANSRWTKQSFKDESDINTIMARYLSTGEMPVINERAPQYLDASGMDFQDMQNKVVEAQSLFMDLPSKLRTRFHHDPAEFLEFCSDPSNRDEMSTLGLLKTPAASLPQPSEDSEGAGKRSAPVSEETA